MKMLLASVVVAATVLASARTAVGSTATVLASTRTAVGSTTTVLASARTAVASATTVLASPAWTQQAPPVIDSTATDVDGRIHRIGADPEPGATALVIMDVGCPIARRYVPMLKQLATRSRALGVTFYGVLSDPNLSRTEAKKFRDDYAITFPVLFDSSGTLADRLQPTHVPEAFVIDQGEQLIYRGRIDNWYAAPTKPRTKPTTREFALAIEAVAVGKKPDVARTEPVGCEFEGHAAGQLGDVTWARHIAPILNANCVECHRAGAIGPFALDTYKRARRRAKMIARTVEDGVMPPWRARPGHGAFRDARIVSDREKALLRAWATAGAPEGDASEAPPVPKAPKGGWPLGEPDAVFAMREPFDVPAEGEDIYRYFVVPMNLTEDRAVVAFDFQPGDATVVHHCIAYVDYSGKARKMAAKDKTPGFKVFGNTIGLEEAIGGEMGGVGGWAPGSKAKRLPAGHAIELPKGGDLVMEVHYHLTGKATRDQSKVALYFTDEPVKKWVQGTVIGTLQVDIPAGEKNYWRHISMKVPADIRLLDIGPHMHFLGEEVEVMATLPGGERVPLLAADWDFRWQGVYIYQQPMFLPEGSRIDAWFRFDNSAENSDNPTSPPKRVRWGWGTTEEMCELYLTYVPDDEDDVSRVDRAAEASWYGSRRSQKAGPPWRK